MEPDVLNPRRASVTAGAAFLAMAGILWVVKAMAILTTGFQPPWIYELGQVLVAAASLGLLGMVRNRATAAAAAAFVSAALAIAGGAGVALGAATGWSGSSAQSFVLPWSLFHLILALGGFVALVGLSLALRRERRAGAGPILPLPIVLAPVPLLMTGVVHVELPVLAIGTSWLLLAGSVRAPSPAEARAHAIRTTR